MVLPYLSPSIRRVWIEIPDYLAEVEKRLVTLHTEGVD